MNVLIDLRSMGIKNFAYRAVFELLKKTPFFILKEKVLYSHKPLGIQIHSDFLEGLNDVLKTKKAFASEIIKSASRMMKGEFPLFNRTVILNRIPDWKYDFYHHCSFTENHVHWSKLSVSPETVKSDPRTVWELNRFGFFPILGLAYFFNKDQGILQYIIELLKDWKQKNPLYKGVNWSSNLEIACRGINLLITYSILSKCDSFSENDQKLMAELIFSHFEYVYQNISWTKRLVPNDHLLVEALFLFSASENISLSNNYILKKWKNKSKKIIISELKRQFKPSGEYFMNAYNYQKFVSEAILLTIIFIKNNRDLEEIKQLLIEKLMDSSTYLNAITIDEKLRTNFGDSDSGCAFRFHFDNTLDVSVLFHMTSVISNKTFDLDAGKVNLDEKNIGWSYVFLGQKAEGFSLKPNKTKDNHLLSISLIQFGDFRLEFFKHSMVQYGQSDLLQICLYHKKEPILIDPGTVLYNLSPLDRKKVRSSLMHNTLSVNAMDQCKQHRYFRWASKALTNSRLIHHSNSSVVISAEHDGYEETIGAGVIPSRSVIKISEAVLFISDHVKKNSNHLLTSIEVNYNVDHHQRFLLNNHHVIFENSKLEMVIHDDYGKGNLTMKEGFSSLSYTQRHSHKILNYKITEPFEGNIYTLFNSSSHPIIERQNSHEILINGESPTYFTISIGSNNYIYGGFNHTIFFIMLDHENHIKRVLFTGDGPIQFEGRQFRTCFDSDVTKNEVD